MLSHLQSGHQSWYSQSKRQTVSQRASCKERPGLGFYMCRKGQIGLGHQQGRRQSHHLFAHTSQPAELEASLHPKFRQSHTPKVILTVQSWDPAPNHLLKTSTGIPQSWQLEFREGSWFIQVGLNQTTVAIKKNPCNWSLWSVFEPLLFFLARNQAVSQGAPLYVRHHCSVILVHAPVPFSRVTCTCEALIWVQISKNRAKHFLNEAQPQQMKILAVKSSPASIYLPVQQGLQFSWAPTGKGRKEKQCTISMTFGKSAVFIAASG